MTMNRETPPLADPAPPASESASSSRLYFPALDGLRFFAFFLVYLFHNGIPQWGRWVRSVVHLIPGAADSKRFDALGTQIQQNGWIGVQLFFVLSGFLIARLLLRERELYGRIDLRSFWVRRILRIWPLYYATLLLACVFLPLAVRGGFSDLDRTFLARQLPSFAAYLGNWSMGFLGPPPNGAITVLWSVCVEEQFYLFGPLLFLIPRRLGIGLILLALGGLAIYARYRLGLARVNPLLFQYNTISHLDALGAGVALAIAHERFTGLSRLWVLQIPAAAALVVILAQPNLGRGTPWKASIDFVLIWLVCLILIASLIQPVGPLGRLFAYNRLVYLGKISYGLYMLHEIVLTLSREWSSWLGWYPNKEILETIARFAATLLVAGLSYRYLEQPFLRLKSRWTRVLSRPI